MAAMLEPEPEIKMTMFFMDERNYPCTHRCNGVNRDRLVRTANAVHFVAPKTGRQRRGVIKSTIVRF
jgi:hypothetical protein